MIAVSELRSRKVSLQWQEAVAIVQELADNLGRSGRAASVPDANHVAITPGGDLVVLRGGSPGDHPVKQLACTLQTLVEGTNAPPELCLLVSDNTGQTPRHASVEEFSRALAIFERPGRRTHVARVATRAAKAEAQSRMELELERLRTQASEAAETRAQHDPHAHNHAPRRRWLLPVAASVVILAGLAALWLRGAAAESSASSSLRTLVSRTEDRLADFLLSGIDALTIPRSPEPSQSGGSAAGSAPTSSTEGHRPDAPGTGLPLGQTRVLDVKPAIHLFAPWPVEYVTEGPAGQRDGGQANVETVPVVYTRDDEEVTPPELVYPQLPSVPPPDLPADRLGVLDILVSEAGEVERVKLVPPANRFRERMIVAAAKAWRFRPALRDGQPVRYRLWVRVTL